MARGWIDTYRSAQEVAEDREYKAKRKSIMDAQPEEGMSFTPEQGQRLAGLDPSRYSIGHDGSAYTVSDNENPQATQVIAPSSQYKFLGNQSASAYSPQQIDQMRGRALADLEAVRDPTKGLNLRAAVDARYQAEKKIADEEALKVKTADFYRNMAGMQTRDLVQYTNELLKCALFTGMTQCLSMKSMKSPVNPLIGEYPSPTRLLAEWAPHQDVEAIDRKVSEVASERLGYCANNPVNQQVCFIGKLSLEFPRLHEILLRSNKI